MRNKIYNLVLVLGTVALTLGAAEIAARLRVSWLARARAERGNEGSVTRRTVAGFHRSEDPRLVYEMTPCAACENPINTHGFRGPEVTVPKPADTYRIAVAGDSVTFGAGVAWREAFPHQMESHLNRWMGLRAGPGRYTRAEIINAGIPGYNVVQVRQSVMTRALPLAPDLVIYGFYPNDFYPERIEFRRTAAGDELITVTPEQPGPANPFVRVAFEDEHSWFAFSALFQWFRDRQRAKQIAAWYLEAPDETNLRLGMQHIFELHEDLQAAGVAFAVALLPPLVLRSGPGGCVDGQFGPQCGPYAARMAHVAQAVAAAQIGLVDLRSVYDGFTLAALQVAAEDIDHPNPPGHGQLARRLAAAVADYIAPELELAQVPRDD